MARPVEGVLVALQLFQVAFLWLHDWVPLGCLNDVSAAQTIDSRSRLVVVTLLSSVPFSFGLVYALIHWNAWPYWFYWWLVASYGLLLLGQLRAWWLPYLVYLDPDRAKRYAIMFPRTHSFLPMRNGIAPNTLHVLLHASTVATLMILCWSGPWRSL